MYNSTAAVWLFGNDVTESDIVVADLELDGESTTIASGAAWTPVPCSRSGGICADEGSQQLVGFVVYGGCLAAVEGVVVGDGTRLGFRKLHIHIEEMEVCADAEWGGGDDGLPFVCDGVGGLCVGIGEDDNQLSVGRGDRGFFSHDARCRERKKGEEKGGTQKTQRVFHNDKSNKMGTVFENG